MVDIADIKIAVLKCAMGICALEERDLYERLERFWADAFAMGCKETGKAMLAELERQGFMGNAAVEKLREAIDKIQVTVQQSEKP